MDDTTLNDHHGLP